MVKKKSRSSNGAAESHKNQEDSKLPSFDENALSVLTAKIERGLDKKQPDTKDGKTSSKSLDHGRSKPALPAKSSGPKSKSKATPPASRGVKRDASGNAKFTGNRSERAEGAEENTRETLLQEILALGGTADDLDLVADAPSDEDGEYETNIPVDKSLQRDLARFAEELGIEKSSEKEQREESGDDVEDGWEASELDSMDDASVVEEQFKKKVHTEVLREKEPHNDPTRLVSILLL